MSGSGCPRLKSVGCPRDDKSRCRTRKLILVLELPEGTVTVLFTDVVGSTELTNRLGDEPAREVLGASDQLVRDQVVRRRAAFADALFSTG